MLKTDPLEHATQMIFDRVGDRQKATIRWDHWSDRFKFSLIDRVRSEFDVE
jgi:hypothetical protein